MSETIAFSRLEPMTECQQAIVNLIDEFEYTFDVAMADKSNKLDSLHPSDLVSSVTANIIVNLLIKFISSTNSVATRIQMVEDCLKVISTTTLYIWKATEASLVTSDISH